MTHNIRKLLQQIEDQHIAARDNNLHSWSRDDAKQKAMRDYLVCVDVVREQLTAIVGDDGRASDLIVAAIHYVDMVVDLELFCDLQQTMVETVVEEELTNEHNNKTDKLI